jgi:hypothetical protein
MMRKEMTDLIFSYYSADYDGLPEEEFEITATTESERGMLWLVDNKDTIMVESLRRAVFNARVADGLQIGINDVSVPPSPVRYVSIWTRAEFERLHAKAVAEGMTVIRTTRGRSHDQ